MDTTALAEVGDIEAVGEAEHRRWATGGEESGRLVLLAVAIMVVVEVEEGPIRRAAALRLVSNTKLEPPHPIHKRRSSKSKKKRCVDFYSCSCWMMIPWLGKRAFLPTRRRTELMSCLSFRRVVADAEKRS